MAVLDAANTHMRKRQGTYKTHWMRGEAENGDLMLLLLLRVLVSVPQDTSEHIHEHQKDEQHEAATNGRAWL